MLKKKTRTSASHHSTKHKPVRSSKESPARKRVRAATIIAVLHQAYPESSTALIHRSPFQLLVATMLSAQCTDQRVNAVTQNLFARYASPADFASISQEELETIIYSTGFFRMKAKNIIACSKELVKNHDGQVPATMDALTRLPGVGRKTANVVLSEAFGLSEGIVVDTHVHRLARRLGLTKRDDPVRIERDLMDLVAPEEWRYLGGLLILHGRRVCAARRPACERCQIAEHCPSVVRQSQPPRRTARP
jgi:endonuclease-3